MATERAGAKKAGKNLAQVFLAGCTEVHGGRSLLQCNEKEKHTWSLEYPLLAAPLDPDP